MFATLDPCRRTIAAACLLALGMLTPVAQAGSGSAADAAEARSAYSAGTQAYRKGDFTASAREYSRADALAPNDVALQAALESAVLADDVVLGMELLERSRRGPVKKEGLKKAVEAARQKFQDRAGRVHFPCSDTLQCTATIDGVSVDTRSMPWLLVGEHTVVLSIGERSSTLRVTVSPGAILDVSPGDAALPSSAPSASVSAPPAASSAPIATWDEPPVVHKGLSPVLFFVGAGATLALAGVTVWSALDAKSQLNGNCASSGPDSCLSGDDSNAQKRTNTLLGLTSGMAVATALVGILWTNWKGEPKRRAVVLVSPTSVVLRSSF
jgi:hypothetical protein